MSSCKKEIRLLKVDCLEINLGSTFGNIFGSKGERAEKAIEFYKSAATQYKLAKRWEDAAKAYLRCVSCDQSLRSGETGEFYVEAAKAI